MEFKKGILSAAGARRLGVPHLAGPQVDYEPKYDEKLGAYAGEIYHQGTRLGCSMTLGRDGIIPCDEVMDVEESIEQFVKRHSIEGYLSESASLSAVFLPESTRCFEVSLSRNGVTVSFSAYVGLAHPRMAVPDALRHLAEAAENYRGEPDFATWNDEGYCEQLLGREVAEGLYRYYRETYDGLVKVLGEDLCQDLMHLVTR